MPGRQTTVGRKGSSVTTYTPSKTEKNRWSQMLGLTWNWFSGTGSRNVIFKNDYIADSLRDANVVNQARAYWYSQVNLGNKSITDSLENFRGAQAWTGGNFGITGAFKAGLDPVEQFIGSFRVDMTSDGTNLEFTIKNTTSLKSLLYGVGPEFERGRMWFDFHIPLGNTRQTYIFSEPINMEKIRE